MASFLPGGPATSERIDDLASELVLSLELSRGEGCDLAATSQAADRLVHAFHGALVAAEETERADSSARVDDVCRLVERAYTQWKGVDDAFTNTIRLAYEHQVPRANLQLDDIHTVLKQRVGDPIAEAYTELRARWVSHVAAHPWDTFLNRAPDHVDHAGLDQALNALARGDDLDIEDALEAVTGPLRHAFADHVRTHPTDLDDLEIGLWRRPEMLVAGDYWGHAKSLRLLDVLADSSSERTKKAASTLTDFFAPGRSAASIVRRARIPARSFRALPAAPPRLRSTPVCRHQRRHQFGVESRDPGIRPLRHCAVAARAPGRFEPLHDRATEDLFRLGLPAPALAD